MKKIGVIGIIGLGVVIMVAIGIYVVKNPTEKSTPQMESYNPPIKIVNVDKIVNAPDKYKGYLGAEGKVIEVDESKSLFLLGCEDACIFMPVKYKGQIPVVGTEIVVYGEIKKQEDGKYVFEGKEVKMK